MQESQTITKKSASNLTLGFLFLPQARREGMSVLYAFCREVDDVADEDELPVEKRREQLAAWREDARRDDNGAQVRRVAQLALTSRPSVDFSGYYQRHLKAA